MTPAAANRLAQDSQTQLLVQILSDNNSSTMTAGLLASASSGHRSRSGPVPLSGGPPLVGTHYPSVSNPGNQTNAEGASVALQIIASSGNGDPMLFGSSGLPVGLTFDSATGLISGTLAYTDAETQSGNYSVTVTAYDTVTGSTGSATFTWTITNVNLPPVLATPGDQTNGVGDGVALSMAATDGDGDRLTYSATNLPSGLTINTSTGLISGVVASAAARNNPYAVTVTASDGAASASQSFNWTITHVLIDSPGDQNNLDGDAVSLQINAWNPYGTALAYSATGLPSGLTINSTSGLISGTVGSTDSASSPYSVTVTASDGTYSAATSFNWTITHLAVENPGGQTNAEGDVVSLQMIADINTTETVTYSASGLPSGLSISTSTGLITGTVANLDANSSPYSVTVSATAGTKTASQAFSWTVTHILLTNPGSQISAQGTAASLQIQASDPDNDRLTFGASGLPAGLSVNTSTGLISGTISSSAGAGSPYTANVTAADATHTATQTFTWSVTNASVTVTNPGTQNSADGATVSLQISASDTAGDPLSFSAVGLPPGLGIDYASGLISGNIDPTAVGPSGGSFKVTVMADNSQGKTGSQTFTWNVTYTNQTPVVTNPGDQLNLTGDVVNLTVWGYDLDGETVSYTATNLPSGLSISASTGVISGTISSSANTNSPYNVTVTASDGTLSASQTFNWTVTNGAVTVTQPSDQTNTEGNAVSLQIPATSSYGYPLTYSALALPTGLSINASTGLISGTVALTAAEDVVGGVYTTSVTAADTHGHSGAKMFSWTVADLHQAPTLTNPGSQTNAEGDPVSLQLQGSSPNAASLTYTASGLPTGLFIDSFTGLISGTVDYSAAETGGGHYTTLVSVNDGNGGTASQTFTWTITNTDQAPWLAYPGFQTNKVGDTVSLQLAAGDYDGDSVTYSATGLPAGLSINGATGLVSGTITASAGTYSATATASDGHLTTNQSFSWQVTSSATGQVILAINDTVSTSDDLAFINPGQPVQAVPIQVTLVNASPGLHQITLTSTPGGRVSLSNTSFQLANGGTTTVMLTPLQLSQAFDDVVLAAFVGGVQGGGGKVTVVAVTIDQKISAADTPKGMPNRIPPREKSKFNYTVSDTLPADKPLWIGLQGKSALNGDASFNGSFGAIRITKSGSFEIAGDAGKQTEPGNAGKLFVDIEKDGSTDSVAKSLGFSVAAIPVGFSTTYKDDGRFKRKDGTIFAGLIVDMQAKSDSLERSDLDKVFVKEAIEDKELMGTLKNSPNITNAAYLKTPASDPFPDRHLTTVDAIKAEGGTAITNQVWVFLDNRTGAKDFVIANSGYIINVIIKKDPKDGVWKLATTKKGAEVTVKLKDDAGKVTAEYTSEAGLTDPKAEVSTKKPIAGS
jgi:hypothetical protein